MSKKDEDNDEKKIGWMYKGPGGEIDREAYLLGKRIDKPFEEMAKAEKNKDSNLPKNHVEHECIPPSIRDFAGTEQVDLARKVQEDPLFMIKKKEVESKTQLLKNPVRLKQLKEMLEAKSKNKESDKSSKAKKRKKKKKQESDSSSDEDLDSLLIKKYKQLSQNLGEDIFSSVKETAKSDKIKRNDEATDNNRSDSRRNYSYRDRNEFFNERKRDSRDQRRSPDRRDRNRYSPERHQSNVRRDSRERIPWKEAKETNDRRDDRYTRERKREGGNDRQASSAKVPSKNKLSDEEKQKKLREMMDNAKWRDEERVQNVKKYREQDKLEDVQPKRLFYSR